MAAFLAIHNPMRKCNITDYDTFGKLFSNDKSMLLIYFAV